MQIQSTYFYKTNLIHYHHDIKNNFLKEKIICAPKINKIK